jgi:hypothetical protein
LAFDQCADAGVLSVQPSPAHITFVTEQRHVPRPLDRLSHHALMLGAHTGLTSVPQLGVVGQHAPQHIDLFVVNPLGPIGAELAQTRSPTQSTSRLWPGRTRSASPSAVTVVVVFLFDLVVVEIVCHVRNLLGLDAGPFQRFNHR